MAVRVRVSALCIWQIPFLFSSSKQQLTAIQTENANKMNLSLCIILTVSGFSFSPRIQFVCHGQSGSILCRIILSRHCIPMLDPSSDSQTGEDFFILDNWENVYTYIIQMKGMCMRWTTWQFNNPDVGVHAKFRSGPCRAWQCRKEIILKPNTEIRKFVLFSIEMCCWDPARFWAATIRFGRRACHSIPSLASIFVLGIEYVIPMARERERGGRWREKNAIFSTRAQKILSIPIIARYSGQACILRDHYESISRIIPKWWVPALFPMCFICAPDAHVHPLWLVNHGIRGTSTDVTDTIQTIA